MFQGCGSEDTYTSPVGWLRSLKQISQMVADVLWGLVPIAALLHVAGLKAR